MLGCIEVRVYVNPQLSPQLPSVIGFPFYIIFILQEEILTNKSHAKFPIIIKVSKDFTTPLIQLYFIDMSLFNFQFQTCQTNFISLIEAMNRCNVFADQLVCFTFQF